MGVDNLVVLRRNVGFETGVIIKIYQKVLVKKSVYMIIPIAGRAIPVQYKVFMKLRVVFNFIVLMKNTLFQFWHHIEEHIDVVVKVLEMKTIVSFWIIIDYKFIEFWGIDLMFQSPNPTNFLRMSTF